ncbi:unnamed protein product [marine sediment metagenome]|uniref:Fibronectin type-III domain-containing protein n=1 Tax=marine sediment metagenome TaxID=412755 RepID=X1E6W7_9ZZZZ
MYVLRCYTWPSGSVEASSDNDINEEQWYCVEIMAPATINPATVRWWIDGVEQQYDTDLQNLDLSGFGNWDQVQIGVDYGTFALTPTIYFDEVIVSTEPIGVIDDMAPDAITNLSASTGTNEGEIDLSWTAPGDDGTRWAIIGGQYAIQFIQVEYCIL